MQTLNKQHQETRSLFAAVLALTISVVCGVTLSCGEKLVPPSLVNIYCQVIDSLTEAGILGAWAAEEDTSAEYQQFTDTEGEIRLRVAEGSTHIFYFGAVGYTTKSKVFENLTADIQGVVIELAQ